MRRPITALAALVPAVLLAAPVQAQLISGRLVLDRTADGVEGARVVLLNAADARVAAALTDSTGAFKLSVPDPGFYVLEAERIGLAVVRASVEVGEREIVEVELRTSERAIPIEPIEVVARRRIRLGTLDEFYDRMERMKQKGDGFFLTKEDLARLERRSLPMALASAPGVHASPSAQSIRLSGPGGLCTPDIYLDGLPLEGSGGKRSFQGISPSASGFYPFGDGGSESFTRGFAGVPVIDLEGVEIYRGRFERADDYWPNPCGTIFLWRKRDWGNPFSWKTVFLAGGLSAGLAFLLM